MTAPWAAFPPEVLSGWLHAGPGSGPTELAAATWAALSLDYAQAATELEQALLDTAPQWESVSAEAYQEAHQYYLQWLIQISHDCAEIAAAYREAATAFDVAMAQMPTPAELIENRAAEVILIASNFFGINTVTLGENEAQYLRMWLTAAETMGIYQFVAETVLARASDPPLPAPVLVRPGILTDALAASYGPHPALGPPGSRTAFAAELFVGVVQEITATIADAGYHLFRLLTTAAWVVTFPVRLALVMAWPSLHSVNTPAGVLSTLVGYAAIGASASADISAATTMPLPAGAGIALPVSLPLGVGRHAYDLQLAATVRPSPEPAVLGIAQGSGRMGFSGGFSGTGHQDITAQPRGLTALTSGQFDSELPMPITPATWTSAGAGAVE